MVPVKLVVLVVVPSRSRFVRSVLITRLLILVLARLLMVTRIIAINEPLCLSNLSRSDAMVDMVLHTEVLKNRLNTKVRK